MPSLVAFLRAENVGGRFAKARAVDEKWGA